MRVSEDGFLRQWAVGSPGSWMGGWPTRAPARSPRKGDHRFGAGAWRMDTLLTPSLHLYPRCRRRESRACAPSRAPLWDNRWVEMRGTAEASPRKPADPWCTRPSGSGRGAERELPGAVFRMASTCVARISGFEFSICQFLSFFLAVGLRRFSLLGSLG